MTNELDDILSTLRKVESIDLSKVVAPLSLGEKWASEKEKSRLEGRLRTARRNKKKSKGKSALKIDRRTKEGRTKMHWTARKRKERERYREVKYPRYLRKMSQLIDSEGWYPVITAGWIKEGWDVQLTREEWDTHIEPLLREGNHIPFTKRYNTRDNVIRIDNIMIYPKEGKKPIFDGAEFKMLQLGYIL